MWKMRLTDVGTVTWVFKADNGTHSIIWVPAYYVPSLVGLVGTKKVGFLTRPTVRCKGNTYHKCGNFLDVI